MLVEMAAFLGEQLRKEMGGEWDYDFDPRHISIRALNGHIIHSYSSLSQCVDMWKYQDINFCRGLYLIVLANKAPLTMEQEEQLMKWEEEIYSKRKKTR